MPNDKKLYTFPLIMLHHWILIDKAIGMTSTAVTAVVKRLSGAKKAGHCGTLDPLATGLLPVALNEATKSIPYVLDEEKAYTFTVRWGVATETDDAEGAVVAQCDVIPGVQDIQSCLHRFTGPIQQVPPRFSAIKMGGERAYHLARQGVDFEMSARAVVIHTLQLHDVPSPQEATFSVTCSKGTYVRSLARDIANALGTHGHVVALRRVAVGKFHVNRAISLDCIRNLGHIPVESDAVLSVQEALADIPALTVQTEDCQKLKKGVAVSLVPEVFQKAGFPREIQNLKDEEYMGQKVRHGLAICTHQGMPVAIVQEDGGLWYPIRVFNCQ